MKDAPSAAPQSTGRVTGTTRFAPVADETRLDTLLESLSVQRELDLTAKQARALDAVHDSQFKRNNPIYESFRNATGNPARRREIWAVIEVQMEQFRKEIKAELTPAQAKRLIQISAQHAGIRAFLVPEVAEALNLAPDRQQNIKKILEDYDVERARLETEVLTKDQQAIQSFPGGKWDDFRKSDGYRRRHELYDRDREANRSEANRAILRELTRGQRDTFKTFLGTPFDPEKLMRPGDKPPPAPGSWEDIVTRGHGGRDRLELPGEDGRRD